MNSSRALHSFFLSLNLPIVTSMEATENKINQHQDFYKYYFSVCNIID